jgi:hypothetical protein
MEGSILHVYGTFFLFGGIIITAMPLVYFILPETKDVSLELVQSFFTPLKTVFYIDLDQKPITNAASANNLSRMLGNKPS